MFNLVPRCPKTFTFFSNKDSSLNFYKELSKYGHIAEVQDALIFFGNENFDAEVIDSFFPRRHTLTQVHGDKTVPSSSNSPRADGHFTTSKGLALVIKTADCMPVFMVSPTTIFALHIGWRGLQQRILSKCLKSFIDQDPVEIFVGPHIGFSSFQLNETLTLPLLSEHQIDFKESVRNNFIIKSLTQKNHYFVNLWALLNREAKQYHQSLEVRKLGPNTYSSPIHYSHRRNRWRVGTNSSLIVKKPHTLPKALGPSF